MLKKIKILFTTFVAGLSFSAVSQESAKDAGPWSSLVDVKGYQSSLDGKETSTSIYANVSYAFANKDSFSIETRNDLHYKEKDVSNFRSEHYYIRMPYSQKNVAQLGAFTLNLTYRYTVPSSNKAQVQGSLGTLLFRPDLKAKFGSTSLEILSGFYGHMQRKGTPVNAKTTVVEGNPVFQWVPEVVVEQELASGFTAVADLSLELTYVHGGTNGSKNLNSRWTKSLEQEYVVKYSNDILDGYTPAIGYLQSSAFATIDEEGKKSKFKLFNKTGAVYFAVSKLF